MFNTVDTPSDYTASKGRKIEYIVLHYTAGVTLTSTSALSVCKWWNKDPNKASADFVVDDESIWQYNPDIKNNYCWHGGGKKYNYKGGARLYGICKNSNSISIELCSYRDDKNANATAEADGWRITDKTIQNGIELVHKLRTEYNIPAENVITHFDITSKLCPRPFLIKKGDTWTLIDDIMAKFREDTPPENVAYNELSKFFANNSGKVFELIRVIGGGSDSVVAMTSSIDKLFAYDSWQYVFISESGYATLINKMNNTYLLKPSKVIWL